jgi:hypothetical protein
MTIQHSMEWNEILGDMIEDAQESEVLEAAANEQELTSADLDDWYTSLIIAHENYEDHKDKV